MLAYSSIAETALGELPPLPVEKDLGISVLDSVSTKRVIPETAVSLSKNFVTTAKPVYYGGNRNSWLAAADIDVVFSTSKTKIYPPDVVGLTKIIEQNISVRFEIPEDIILTDLNAESTNYTIHNYPLDEYSTEISIESLERPSWLISDPAVTRISGSFVHTFTKNFFDESTLSVDIIERRRADDLPSESWRPRPGLPIGPISFNPIGIEQWSGGQSTFGDVSSAELIITAEDFLNKTFSYPIGPELDINEDSVISVTYNSIDSTTDTVLFIETKTYTKEYTFLIQGFIEDRIDLTLAIQSSEVYVESPGISVQARGSQIWIGA
jgi:hypothetical protein